MSLTEIMKHNTLTFFEKEIWGPKSVIMYLKDCYGTSYVYDVRLLILNQNLYDLICSFLTLLGWKYTRKLQLPQEYIRAKCRLGWYFSHTNEMHWANCLRTAVPMQARPSCLCQVCLGRVLLSQDANPRHSVWGYRATDTPQGAWERVSFSRPTTSETCMNPTAVAVAMHLGTAVDLTAAIGLAAVGLTAAFLSGCLQTSPSPAASNVSNSCWNLREFCKVQAG